jgi:hypothetical protein
VIDTYTESVAPLQCSWLSDIDIEGLDTCDQTRIRQVGFNAWKGEQVKYRKLSDAELGQIKSTDISLLRQMIQAIDGIGPKKSEKFYVRATHKLAWFLKAGYRLDQKASHLDPTTLIRLYSEVNESEMGMSDREFYETWSDDAAADRLKQRTKKGLFAVSGPTQKRQFTEKKCLCQKCGEVFIALTHRAKLCPACGGLSDASQETLTGQRPCKSDDKCLKADRRGRPVPAAKGKQYCTENCHESDVARRNRLLPTVGQEATL